MGTICKKAIWGGSSVLAALITFGASPAFAQADASRMFRSVFNTPEEPARMVLSLSMSEGFGDTPETYVSDSVDASTRQGAYTEITPSASVRVGGRRHSLGVSGRSTMRYDGDRSFVMLGRSFGAGVQNDVGRTAFRLDQTLWDRPFYSFVGVPPFDSTALGALPESVPEEAAVPRSVFESYTSASVSRQVQQYLWLTGQYSYRYTSVSEVLGEPVSSEDKRGEHRAAIFVGRQVTRQSRLRFGYEYRSAGAVDVAGAPVAAHNFNVGFDRGQALNLTRFTTVSFTVGPALVQSQSDTGVTVAGDVKVRQQLGRFWSLRGSVRRGLVYAEGFGEPMMMNGYEAGVDGAIGRRVTVNASYGSGRGYTDLTTLSRASANVSSVAARAGVQFALYRYLGAFVEYWFYHQTIASEVPGGADTLDDKTGLRIGVLYRVPLFKQPRRGAE